jgi:hypothetical protein
MWFVPAQFEGEWRLEVDGRTATLDLEQNFQKIEGTITGDGGTSRVEQGHVYGRVLRFVADAGNGRREYLGRITDDGRIVPIRGQTGWQAARAS